MKIIYLIILPFFIGCTTQPIAKNRAVTNKPQVTVNKNPRKDALIVGVGNYKNRIRPLD